ncbi:MAG: hypothetical protein EOP74_00155 [Variovorax sp.]|nr:MAG: hypothetical protein EOP74_00155 [Variovorax sp.]
MKVIALGLAFANYLSNPCASTVDAVVIAMEGRTDLPIDVHQTRQALLDGIPQVLAAKANSASGKTESLMQRLLKGQR